MASKEQLHRPILIVEDDPMDAEILLAAIHEVDPQRTAHWATDAEGAWELLKACLRDGTLPLVVLDLDLGRDHGMDLLESWRMQAALRSMQVVVLTSSGYEGDVRRAELADAASYYLKPAVLPDYVSFVQGLDGFGSAPASFT